MNKESFDLWAYLEGKLSPQQEEIIQQQLAIDEQLRQELEEVREAHMQLEQMEVEEPSAGFTDRVMAALPARLLRIPDPFKRNNIHLLVVIFTTAMVVLAFILGGSSTEWIMPERYELSLPAPIWSVAGTIGALSLILIDRLMRRSRQT